MISVLHTIGLLKFCFRFMKLLLETLLKERINNKIKSRLVTRFFERADRLFTLCLKARFLPLLTASHLR